METMPGLSIIFFILGTIIGSFLNVVVLRYERSRSVNGRSFCPKCFTVLKAFELIPVVSFIVQRGMCRTCHNPISIQYPVVELLTGFIFMGLYLLFGFPTTIAHGLVLVAHMVLMSLLIVILAYDIRHTIIPNVFVYPFNLLALALLFVNVSENSVTVMLPTLTELLAGPILFLPFFLLWLYSRGRWIGLGDAKLVVGIGWILGLTGGVSSVMYAFWIGAVMSVLLLIMVSMGKSQLPGYRKHFTMKSEIPFAPFLIVGHVIVFFFGIDIVQSLLLT